ncbi:MAG: HDIG domain-containing protein [Roseiflexaceae bacterium]|nr:HDIG domain-containing protein [Roseiflexaceae bacterium]
MTGADARGFDVAMNVRQWFHRSARTNQPQSDELPHQSPEHVWRRLVVGLSLGLALVIWLALAWQPVIAPDLRLGQPSPRDIQADRTITYVSAWRTEQERTRAESSADTVVYSRDMSIPIQQRTELKNLLQTITQIRDDPTLTKAQERERLTSLPNSTLVISPELASAIARQTDESWASVSNLSLELYDRALSENRYMLNDQKIAELRAFTLPYWASLQAETPEQAELIALFSGSFLKTNQFIDEEATQRRKQEVRDAVQPVTVRILEGESIVRQGDVVTPDVLEKLEALGALRTKTNWASVGGRALLALLFASVFGAYIVVAQRDTLKDVRPLLLVFGLIALAIVAARLIGPLGSQWTLAFPVALIAMLLAALFNVGLALMSVGLLSAVIASLSDNHLATAMTLSVGGVAGAFLIGRGERSLLFFISGVAVFLVTAAAQFTFHLIAGALPVFDQALTILAVSGINGALSAILALGLYNLAGQLAGIVTPLRLMELAHPAQPLLRRLIREAPGTYYHSVAVGNLAESAAEAIGADALLLRVASYYHDIGKTIRPFFFTDNQSDRENVHDDLDPLTSAQIIADHVREGQKMAIAAGLPSQIVDFITTHHGTSVIKYFYQRALQQHDTVNIEDYRYPGPRPRTREQGIMTLADSVEATVRSKFQAGCVISSREAHNGDGRIRDNGQTLEELVTAIIEERVRSGQLDECPLTLRDLARIRQAFITTLQGIYHPRVDYTPGKPVI